LNTLLLLAAVELVHAGTLAAVREAVIVAPFRGNPPAAGLLRNLRFLWAQAHTR
jgi:hypothetical protein